MTYDVVIATVGRRSLVRLLTALAIQPEPRPGRIWVVEDRGRRGPAAARNAGWRASQAEWIAFRAPAGSRCARARSRQDPPATALEPQEIAAA